MATEFQVVQRHLRMLTLRVERSLSQPAGAAEVKMLCAVL